MIQVLRRRPVGRHVADDPFAQQVGVLVEALAGHRRQLREPRLEVEPLDDLPGHLAQIGLDGGVAGGVGGDARRVVRRHRRAEDEAGAPEPRVLQPLGGVRLAAAALAVDDENGTAVGGQHRLADVAQVRAVPEQQPAVEDDVVERIDGRIARCGGGGCRQRRQPITHRGHLGVEQGIESAEDALERAGVAEGRGRGQLLRHHERSLGHLRRDQHLRHRAEERRRRPGHEPRAHAAGHELLGELVADVVELRRVEEGHSVSRPSGSRHDSRAGHPASRRCSSLRYSRYPHSSRLAIRAPRPGLMPRSTGTGH